MPVIQIRALPQKQGIFTSIVLKNLCCEVAQLMQIPSQRVWATWETLEGYSEGEKYASTQPETTHPPLVQLILFEGRPVDLIERILEKIAEVLCRELELQTKNIFILYTAAQAGNLYTGGTIRRSL